MRLLTSLVTLGVVTSRVASAQDQEPLGQLEPQQPVNQASSNAPSYRDELLELHAALVKTPSVSGAEHKVGKVLQNYLAAKGFHTATQTVDFPDSVDDDRLNIVAWKGDDVNKARVLVTSHIDVVPPYIPYGIDPGEITSDTMIRGRGSVDAKGSVAAQVIALLELLEADKIPEQDVMLAYVVGEEVGGSGMRVFSDSKSPRPAQFESVIFGEPTENKLSCGHKGGLFCDVTAEGKASHSGYPWLGKSANELMIRALAKVIDTDFGSSELFGNTTINIGRFDGGVAGNVVPAHALVKLAFRVAIGPEAEGGAIVKKKLEHILNEVDDEAFGLECSRDIGYGSVECNCDVDGFETITVNYGTDIPNLAGDHTRYLYGPGSILVAHGDHENLTVADLETAVEGYQRLILHAVAQ